MESFVEITVQNMFSNTMDPNRSQTRKSDSFHNMRPLIGMN